MSEGNLNKFLIVGLGEVALTHLEALLRLDQTIVGGVDIDSSKSLKVDNNKLPTYRNIKEAVYHNPDINVVIIATPTPLHYATFKQLLPVFQSRNVRVLIEKPCSIKLQEVREMLTKAPDNIKVESLLHYAYCPEVLWASKLLPEWLSQHGHIKNYQAIFTDPRHLPNQEQKRLSLGSSWLDLGINALSAADRILDLTKLDLHPLQKLFNYRAVLSFTSGSHKGTGNIVTKWETPNSIYNSKFTFDDGSFLELDHFIVNGSFKNVSGKTILSFNNDDTPRRLSHYINLYKDVLGDRKISVSTDDSLRLHRLLLNDIA